MTLGPADWKRGRDAKERQVRISAHGEVYGEPFAPTGDKNGTLTLLYSDRLFLES